MKATIVILFLSVTLSYSQDLVYDNGEDSNELFEIANMYCSKNYRDMKQIRKRFEHAGYYREFFYYDGWYMELEEEDEIEYYKLLGITFYCIPKRKLERVQMFLLFNDTGDFNDDEIYFKE